MLKYLLLFLPLFGKTQEKLPKKANTIELYGASFTQIANGLLDAGYTFDKIDSNFQTIKTEFKDGSGKNKWMKMRLYVRMKDSTAFINGEWYNTLVIGHKLLGQEQTIENSTSKIEYSTGNSKSCFIEMKIFAESFQKPLNYISR